MAKGPAPGADELAGGVIFDNRRRRQARGFLGRLVQLRHDATGAVDHPDIAVAVLGDAGHLAQEIAVRHLFVEGQVRLEYRIFRLRGGAERGERKRGKGEQKKGFFHDTSCFLKSV
jgi:hypothetical protein